MTTMDRRRTADPFEDLRSRVLAHARSVCGAEGATFVLRDGDNCFYVDEDAISPLWKGQRFPIADCISGWAMVHAELVEVGDIETDPRIPLDAYRPTFIRSLAMAPMGVDNPRGAIGVYWSRRGHTLQPAQRDALQSLAERAGAEVAALGVESAPWSPNFSRS